MASSDEEMEDLLLESVTNYYFENDATEPVSFSDLPISWNTSETIQSSNLKIYVRGNAGGGMIYKPVKAWKFDISGVKPEISVLCKDNNWIKLLKPRPSFEEKYIRTILVTVNFLHLVKRNPELPGKRIWKKLSNIFSLHDTKPSPNDLVRHRALIEQAGEQDESLKKSKCFMAVLERNPQMKQKADEDALGKGRSQFVVNDDDVSSDDLEDDSGDEEDGSGGEQDGSADEDDDDEEPFDSVCSICDEGGPLLCCEGSCMRSFHATLRAGKPSKCRSLGFTEKEVQAMAYFECQNCQHKLHQCFACGKLGSSDKLASAEVFQCVNATCGYFYHPLCVAKLLRADIDAAKELEEKIRAGESFTCPLHICDVCKLAGDKANPELQMAVCRRCPKAYHKKCLPKTIAFEEDEDEGIEQRAWEGLLVDRILLYCLKHEIIEDLGTPARDHIQFTLDDIKKKGTLAGVSAEKKIPLKKKMPVLRAPPTIGSKKKTLVDSDLDKMNDVRVLKLQRSNLPKKLPSEKKSVVAKLDGSSGVEERKCLQQKDVVKPTQTEKFGKLESTKLIKAAVKMFVLDSDSERRILDLMNEASSMVTLDDIIGKHEKLISSRSYKQKMDPCKSITLGKVEGSCKAVREAARKLDEGNSVKEAESICGPTVLNQMVKWKGKLRVYLAPFLHGMRYTSFGRHFTKYEKLKEIADLLHWYVKDNDTIVDFCCGANDFSMLMKERLESRGMKCNYKNYDLFQPKNDFCFERRDWMDVKTNELPNGSNLIMGINPPFGVKACKANQFINKALEFKPKLIILTVPSETERLDKKKDAYDLIWEHKDKLSGKSFYLPGSVDVFDKQMEDWNVEAPVLYLWSRHDWTNRHLKIAKKYHHLPGEQRANTSTKIMDGASPFNNRGQASKATERDNASPYTLPLEGTKEGTKEGATEAGNEDIERKFTHKGHKIDKRVNAIQVNRGTKKVSKKKRQREMMNVVGRGAETSQGHKRQRNSPDKPHREVPHHSPHNIREERQVRDVRHQGSPISAQFEHPTHHTSRYQASPSTVEVRDPVHDYLRPSSVRSGNFEDPYYPDTRASYIQPSDIYPSRREIWPEPDHTHTNYLPQNPVNSSLDYARSGMHIQGYNHPYSGGVEQRYLARETSLHNSTSAIKKYSFNLDESSHGRMGANNYDGHLAPPAAPGFYHQHQGPAGQGYHSVMGFASRPANHSYHPTSSGGWIE